MAGNSTRAILTAFFANLGIAIAKFIAFAFTGSSAMLAEGIHSVADTGNQALLILGSRRARRDADEQYQFGYARERYFWAFVVALVLFTLGSLFALWEGWQKLLHPHETTSLQWAIGVLLLSIGLEAFALRTAVKESIPLKGNRSWWRFIREARIPELPVVLLEDLGAITGLIIALIAVSLSAITGDPMWDAMGTIAIGLLLGAIAIVLAIEMKSLLIGESARPEVYQKIKHAIESSELVERLILLQTQHLGPDNILVGAKVEFHGLLTADEVAQAIDEVESDVRAVVPEARPMFIEMDYHRPDYEPAPVASADPHEGDHHEESGADPADEVS